MIPLVLLAGFLGAGKTRFLTDVIPMLHDRGVRVRVVLNDFENAEIDASRLASLNALVTPLNGECVCCISLRDLMDTLYAVPSDSDTVMLIEANGATETDELLGFLTMDSKLAQYTPPLQLTVVDAGRWQKRWFHNALERAQATTSTHLHLNWTDRLGPDRLKKVEGSVREVNARASITTPELFANDLAKLLSAVRDLPTRQALLEATQSAPAVLTSAVPSSAVPASAVPASAVPAAAVPTSAVPTSAVPASHSETGHIHMGRSHLHPFASVSMPLPALIKRESFQRFVKALPAEVVRAKGQVRFSELPDKMFVWNRVEGRSGVKLDECTPHSHSRPVALFVGVRLPLDELQAQIGAMSGAD